MAAPREPSDSENEKVVRFRFPTPADGAPAEEAPAEEDDFAFFCTVQAREAARVGARLEREGIPSHARRLFTTSADGEIKDDEPVEIYVPLAFLEPAREIVTRPDPHAPDDDAADKVEERKRLIEHWWCMRCGKQKLVNLPRSPRWKPVRNLIFAALLVPALVGFAFWTFRRPVFESLGSMPCATSFWCLTLIVLTVLYFHAHREKQCEACGWRTDDGTGETRK